MSEKGWQKARLDEIPSSLEQSYFEEWARDPDYGKGWHSIRTHFGIAGFGVNAYEAAAGEELVVPHDEMDYGRQEELYYISRGRARFVCDGVEEEVGEGELLHVRPEVTREGRALETPTIVFMVGGTPGRPFTVDGEGG